ncbi:MAG: adenylate/guanylate cyclase domain-containing protein [Myxococcota bacterium]|nr:adenylate/guanylate cyclase domain-containing protein [Myxococcota bacterium]
MRERRRILFSLFAALMVTALTLLLGAEGWFQRADLLLWDQYLQRGDRFAKSDIVLVEVTENDIRAEGHWPLSDRRLAEALRALVAADVRTIGLDLYRDLPVSPGVELLERTLASEPRIIAVKKFGDPQLEGIPGPQALEESGRLGFNDLLPDDVGESIRRTALYMTDAQGPQTSFAMLLAQHALAAEGVFPGPDPENADWLRLGVSRLPPLSSGYGGYRDLDSRGYQIMMDYGAANFETVSLSELLSGDFPPSALRDRVAILGASAKSLRDELPIPLGGRLAGMGIHAHVVDQLMRMARGLSASRQALGDWAEAGLVLGVSLLGALLGLGSAGRSMFGVILLSGAILGGLLALLGFGYVAFQAGLWIPVAPPMAAWLGSAGLLTAWVSSREAAQREQLMRIFARHVSSDVAEEIWQNRDAFLADGRPRPQRLMATVLFVDMRGYTARAETMDPVLLMEWVGQFMERMADEIARHGGVVDDYFGDGIKADFGVPVPRRNEEEVDQDARSAVDAALAMARGLEELNADYRSRGLPECGMRIGIHTGSVVAGSLGAAGRLKYTVVGDVVVTAQRLEATDAVPHDFEREPCRILASEATCARLDDRVDSEPLEPIALKGRQERVGLRRIRTQARSVG